MWYVLLLMHVAFLVNTARATCPAVSYIPHPVAGGHCWSSEYGYLASGTVDECYNHCIGTSSPSGEPFVSFIHGKTGRTTENKCYCWADGPFAEGCGDWRTSSTDWNSYIINRVCDECHSGLCSNVADVVEDYYCNSFWGDDSYMILSNNPRSTTTFSNEHCAKYCGYMIYNMGSYNHGDTIRHYVSNRVKGDSQGCFCHYTNVNNDCEISSNQVYNDWYDILYIDTVVGDVDYTKLGPGYCLPDTSGTHKFSGQTFEMCKTLCENSPDCSVIAWHETNSCILDLDGTCEDSADVADTDWTRYKLTPNLLAIGSGSDRGKCYTCDDNTQCASGLLCKHPSDLSHGVDYTWAHEGECKNDNANHQVRAPNYANEIYTIQQCADACRGTSTPNGEKAKGFIYALSRYCICESQHSDPHPDCERDTDPNTNWVRYDFNGGWQADYHWAHDGACPAGGGDDNADNQDLQNGNNGLPLTECADACRGHSWDGSITGTRRHAKGFIWHGSAPHYCYCESVHSHPHTECGTPSSMAYKRYDFDLPYAFAHYGECRYDNANHQIRLTANEPYSIESCASGCKGVSTPNGKKAIGFLYHHGKTYDHRDYDGRCYCESQASYPHPDCDPSIDNPNWARYDFVNYSPVFEYKHDGRCQEGASQPYTPMLSLTGTDMEKASQCSRVCMGAMIAGRGAKGFVVSGTQCECETYDSTTECQNKVGEWKRYDFVREESNGGKLVYETKGYCEPASIHIALASQSTSGDMWVDNCKDACLLHSEDTTHFTVGSDGKCECMQTSAGAHTEHPCEIGTAEVGSKSYTIWNSGAIPDVPGCDPSFWDIRGYGVCISPYEAGCREGELCRRVEATFIDNVGDFKGTYLHPMAMTSDGQPSYIFGIWTSSWLKMVRTDLDGIMRETRYISSATVSDIADLTKENWNNAVQNSNRFTVDGKTDCVADHYCVKYFNVIPYGFPTGCTEGEVCTSVKATFVNTWSRSQGTTPHTWTDVHPKALTIDGIPTFIFGIHSPGYWFWMVRTDLDGVMRETRYISEDVISSYAELTETTWALAEQTSNRFDVNGKTTCVEGHYCVKYFEVFGVQGACNSSLTPLSMSCSYGEVCTAGGGGSATLVMTDSYGDGWNGYILKIGATEYTFTSGHSSTRNIASLTETSMTRVSPGSWRSEVSWTLTCDETGTVLASLPQGSDTSSWTLASCGGTPTCTSETCPAGGIFLNGICQPECGEGIDMEIGYIAADTNFWCMGDGGTTYGNSVRTVGTRSGTWDEVVEECYKDCTMINVDGSGNGIQDGTSYQDANYWTKYDGSSVTHFRVHTFDGTSDVGRCYCYALPPTQAECEEGVGTWYDGGGSTEYQTFVIAPTCKIPCLIPTNQYYHAYYQTLLRPYEGKGHSNDNYGASYYPTTKYELTKLCVDACTGVTQVPDTYTGNNWASVSAFTSADYAKFNMIEVMDDPTSSYPGRCYCYTYTPASATAAGLTPYTGSSSYSYYILDKTSEGCALGTCNPGYSEVTSYIDSVVGTICFTDDRFTAIQDGSTVEQCGIACTSGHLTGELDTPAKSFGYLFDVSSSAFGRCYCYTGRAGSKNDCEADGGDWRSESALHSYNIDTYCAPDACDPGQEPVRENCIDCEAGKYKSSSNATACVDCTGSGEYQDQAGQSSCKVCSETEDPTSDRLGCQCKDGHGGSPCAICQAGRFALSGTCAACGVNEYQDQIGQSSCKTCNGTNEIPNTAKTTCRCKDGYGGDPCAECQAGQFSSDGTCAACGDNEYQDQIGQSSCKTCVAGNYINDEKTTCTICPLFDVKHDWDSGCPSWSTNDGCHCDCGNSGFTGTHCDVCGYGKGYNITTYSCENCTFGYVNTQNSHTAACALLGCDENYGYTSDKPWDSVSEWDPDDNSTNSGNCKQCPTGLGSPAGDGQCVISNCDENFHVSNNTCIGCESPKVNAAGDDPSGPDTECDYPCSENEYFEKDEGCTPCSVPYISDGTKDTCWHQASKYITDKTIHEAVQHPEYYDNHISTSAVTNMDGLFKDKNITGGDVDKMKIWDVSSVTSMREMFLRTFKDDEPFDPDELGWTIHSDVDNTRWKTVVDVSYGVFNADEDVVEVCPGMKLNVIWEKSNTIYNSIAANCSIDGGGLWSGNLGESKVLDLHADPGKRRYFCDGQRSYSAFEVYCNADYDIKTYCNSFVGTVKNGTVLGESCALSNTGLRNLVQKWTADKIRIEAQHGPLSEWDVSYVTDMSDLFNGNDGNPDIRKWDMSNVVHAERMFKNSGFDFLIDNKDFSSLQSASEMFDVSYTGRACGKHLSRAGAKSKLSNLGANGIDNCLSDTNIHSVSGEWWTNRVNTWDKYGHIDDWDVTEVTNMGGLFKNQLSFTTESLSDWQTGSVTTMYAMFENTNFNGDIRFWDVRKVTSFSRMFYNNAVFNYDLSRFEVFSKESTDMTNSRFYVQNVLQLDELYKEEVSDIYTVYAQWKTDKAGTEEVYGPISEWMVHNVLNMTELFKDEDFNEDISHWVVSSVTDMSSMFEGSTFNQPIGGWSTVNVRNMSKMFKGTVFNQDIQLWNVTKVEDMTEMFANSVFSRSIGDWDLFATAADKIKAPRQPDFCIVGKQSPLTEIKVLKNPRGDPSATRECYEHCDNIDTTKRLDIEGRNRWRSWGRVIADENTNYTTWHNFGIVTTSTLNHTCTCLENVEPINGQCNTTSEFQYVFQFRDMLDTGLFDNNTAYRQPMCGLGWRYRDLSSMSDAQLESADTCNICGLDENSDGHRKTIRDCGLCVGEFIFDYCRASPRSFTLKELYDFEKTYFNNTDGSLVVNATGHPLPDGADNNTINNGYVNKFACNCMYEDGLHGCLVVNGRKQVRMAEWYAPGLTNFSDYIDAQGANMRYYCELDFLRGREVRFATGFNSVECTDDVLLNREECELVGGDWDGSCSKCLEPCADPTTGVKEISVERVCTECESGKTVFNNECVTCPNGKYTDENHAWCGKCPAGTRGVNGGCISCVEDLVDGNWKVVQGLFSSFEGAIRCETCSANTFSIGTSCENCPQGYISSASKSSCEESTHCYRGNTSENQALAGDYCVENTCDRGFKSIAVDGGFTCVSSCENGKFIETFAEEGEYCKCYDKWYGDDCDKCDDIYNYTLEDPPKCQERFCDDESKRDCICRNEYKRPLPSQTCIDGDLKEICKDGETDCMCNIATGLEWTEHGICKNDTEKNIIVLECPVIESTGLVIHPPEECFPALRVNDFECSTARRTDADGTGAMCDGICEKDDYEIGARCCVQYSWLCLESMCNSAQYVYREFTIGPADQEGCCLERELCSSYNSTCSIAGGKASRIDFASARAVSVFANDTVFLDECCYNYEYKVEKGWLGKRCDAGKDIESEEECDIAQATADGRSGTSMNSWGTYSGIQWARCSAYEYFGSGGTYRDICRK